MENDHLLKYIYLKKEDEGFKPKNHELKVSCSKISCTIDQVYGTLLDFSTDITNVPKLRDASTSGKVIKFGKGKFKYGLRVLWIDENGYGKFIVTKI